MRDDEEIEKKKKQTEKEVGNICRRNGTNREDIEVLFNFPRYYINKNIPEIYYPSGAYVQGSKTKNGYLCATLDVCAPILERKTICIHRLVAQKYIPNPEGYRYVLHRDEDKTNNRIENLYWSKYSSSTGNKKKQIEMNKKLSSED
jgi:hypothetical protein